MNQETPRSTMAEREREQKLKNDLQIALAKKLFPNMDAEQALLQYTNEDDPYSFSDECRKMLEERKEYYNELEENFDETVEKFLKELKQRVGYKE